MVSRISRTLDFWLKISTKRCGLYTSLYGNNYVLFVILYFCCFTCTCMSSVTRHPFYSALQQHACTNSQPSYCIFYCRQSPLKKTSQETAVNFNGVKRSCLSFAIASIRRSLPTSLFTFCLITIQVYS